MTVNLDDLTLGQAKQLAAKFSGCDTTNQDDGLGTITPVIVCTDKRGVVFGYTDNPSARPAILKSARMALYWSKDVGGVFGLGGIGPTEDCRISGVLNSITLEGVTAVFSVSEAAEVAWNKAKTQGR